MSVNANRKQKGFVKVQNADNLFFNVQTKVYYLIEQVDRRKVFKSLRVRGEVRIRVGPQGEVCYYAVKALGDAKMAIRKIRESKIHTKKRPTFAYFSDVTLEIQSAKSERTKIIAKDGDKNLRPFFEKECPYLDVFERNYEQIWARYINHMAELKPGRKLRHDMRYLLLVLHRAYNQKAIEKNFVKSDFPLKEVSEPIGRALDDWEVRKLVEAALEMKSLKMYRQIKLAVHLGLRKQEIMHLRVDEINLRRKEINLDPKRLKTRQPRGAPIPIHADVYPILKELVSEAEGKYVFPKINVKEKGRTVDWDKPQTDFQKVFERVRNRAKINCRFHDLRHTCITNMVAQRIPVTTISKVMGCSIDLINRIYDHVNENVKDELRSLSKGRFNIPNETQLTSMCKY